MAHTNSTTNYGLPQWIGSDKPTFLGDFNSAFNTIDTQMKSNADTASGAAETASSANATAISANETAVTADGKATLAKNTADAATSAAQSASDLATVAKNTADSAARTAQANNIANLAPAYDETRTYSVGELVTYVDENNSGKLYKCVVAWNTPGAFNINYWDDVTASEAFDGVSIKHIIEVGGMTFKAAFTLIAEYLNTLPYDTVLYSKVYTRGGTSPDVHTAYEITGVNRDTAGAYYYTGTGVAALRNGNVVISHALYCEEASDYDTRDTRGTMTIDKSTGAITASTGNPTATYDSGTYIEIVSKRHTV